MEILGKPTINPFLYYSGKIAGYICVLAAVLRFFGISIVRTDLPLILSYLAYALIVLGITLMSVSIFHLGDSTRVGLPKKMTKLKTGGLYKFSRNPMYIGLNLLTIASIIITSNYITAFLGLYSIIIYHVIILGEEAFLKKRFGKRYEAYTKNVRRY